MKNKQVKYRYYTSSRQSRISLPKAITESLNWKDKDLIHIQYKTSQRKEGLFLYKNGGGTTVSYSVETSSLTIPVSIAQSLHWEDKDRITIEYHTIDEQSGIFLYKKEK